MLPFQDCHIFRTLDDTTQTVFFFFFCIAVLGHNRPTLGGIYWVNFPCETPKQLCGLENLSRASINIRVRRKMGGISILSDLSLEVLMWLMTHFLLGLLIQKLNPCQTRDTLIVPTLPSGNDIIFSLTLCICRAFCVYIKMMRRAHTLIRIRLPHRFKLLNKQEMILKSYSQSCLHSGFHI